MARRRTYPIKSFGIIAVAALLLFAAQTATAAPKNEVDSVEKREVTQFIHTYFRALFSGSLSSVEDISESAIAEYLGRLNANPDYPAFLREYYKAASYEIIDFEVVDDNRVAVEILLTLQDGSQNEVRLFFDREFISNEQRAKSPGLLKLGDSETKVRKKTPEDLQ